MADKKIYRPDGFLYNRLIAGDPEQERLYEEYSQKMTLGLRLYDLRKKAGLSKQAVSNKTGVSTYRITRLEAGDYRGKIPIAVADKVAKAVGGRLVLSIKESSV